MKELKLINIADKIDSRIEKCNPKNLMILEYLKSIIFRNDELVHRIQVGVDCLSENTFIVMQKQSFDNRKSTL